MRTRDLHEIELVATTERDITLAPTIFDTADLEHTQEDRTQLTQPMDLSDWLGIGSVVISVLAIVVYTYFIIA